MRFLALSEEAQIALTILRLLPNPPKPKRRYRTRYKQGEPRERNEGNIRVVRTPRWVQRHVSEA